MTAYCINRAVNEGSAAGQLSATAGRAAEGCFTQRALSRFAHPAYWSHQSRFSIFNARPTRPPAPSLSSGARAAHQTAAGATLHRPAQ
jgi:hypothetical protein